MSTDPDGKKLYTVSADSTVRYWDIRSGKALLFFEAHGGPIIAMCVNHRLMYTASTDGTGKYFISFDWEITFYIFHRIRTKVNYFLYRNFDKKS